jgi:hypothetical protein
VFSIKPRRLANRETPAVTNCVLLQTIRDYKASALVRGHREAIAASDTATLQDAAPTNLFTSNPIAIPIDRLILWRLTLLH